MRFMLKTGNKTDASAEFRNDVLYEAKSDFFF